MKKVLFPLFLCLGLSAAIAQTASVSLITAPCTGNGVIAVNTTGLTPPVTFVYYYGSLGFIAPTVHTSATTADTLASWMGGDVRVYASGAGGSAYTSYSTGPLSYTFASTTHTCPTPSTITATVTGGSGSYSYKWFNYGGTLVSTSNPLVTTTAGFYYLIATDASGCYLDSRYGNDSGCYIGHTSPFTYSMTTTDASCTNGTATVTGLSGGTSPYTYLWSTGATTAGISGLMTGFYSLSITDAAGCLEDSISAFVTQNPFITVNTTITPPTCLDTNGSVTAFGSGGTPPYTYVWSNGATTQTISGLGASSLAVTTHDANGCVGGTYAYLSPSSPITVTYTTSPSSCTAPTGTATLTATGGTAPYTVQWYTSPPQTGMTATNLMSGFYSFKVTDNVGCVKTGTIYIPPTAVIAPGYSITAAACTSNTGAITLSPSGGTAPYTYSWSTGGTTSSLTSAFAGSYTFTITDHNGCSFTATKEIPVVSPVHLYLTTSPASCLYTSDGSITASASGGTSPYTYSWSTGATGATLTGVPTGVYTVHVMDAVGCTAIYTIHLDYNHSTNFCYCTISGNVYHDLNHNCTQQTGEPGIENIQMHCTGMGYAYTDASGYYEFKVPTGTYTISQNILAFYPLSACQSNNITTSVVAASGCVHTVNFADSMNPIHDVHISTWDYSSPGPIPGNTYTQTAIITNEGTLTEGSVLGGYKTDGQLYAPTFTASGVFTSGGGNWYTTPGTSPSLAPGASSQYFMAYTVPTNIPLGTSVLFQDSVAYTTPMANWLADYSPWNNVNYFTTYVIGSYDPNFKEVSPKGYGSNGTITYKDSVLEYMVHFQNTGSWYAQKVVVIDTLDADLDWTTLRPVYESHKCEVQVSETGIATFTFNNINLDPQVLNDARSNGMFTYTVKTRRGLNIGTQIKNRAAIYFDYNQPIYTNTTLNTIGWPQAVPLVNTTTNNSRFVVYPNPASTSFNAVINNDAEGEYRLRVTDIAGKTMINKTMTLQTGMQTINVDASLLTSGVYFVTIAGGDKVQTEKLVIMK